jgi:Ser/Thr protein kinase RdoA (MazF antagonist)
MTAPLHDSVVALLRDPVDVQLASSIFGTADPTLIARRVERFCRDRLGSGVTSCDDFVQSVGAIFVLRLEHGERVVLKFHALGETRLGTTGTLAALTAVYGVQAELARLSLPCAAVVHAPTTWENGAVAAMAYVDGAGADDPREPGVKRAMAGMLAEIARLATPLRDTPALPESRLPSTLWPTPHNVLFDLAAPGGDWIDERARAARSVLDASAPPPVVFHTDFSAANVRVRGGRVCAIYDMDSVALVDEPRAVAANAVHHTYTGEPGQSPTTRDQAQVFVAAYETARGRAFTREERERLHAAAIYAMAYTARCEHSGDPSGARLEGSMREVLRTAPTSRYFD